MSLTPTNFVLVDNLRVNEAVQETIFRPVRGGVGGTEDCVLSSCTEPPCSKIHHRKVSNGVRVNWKASRVAMTQILLLHCMKMHDGGLSSLEEMMSPRVCVGVAPT